LEGAQGFILLADRLALRQLLLVVKNLTQYTKRFGLRDIL